MQVLTDNEFLEKASEDWPEMNEALILLRQEGRIQIFDDGGSPLIVLAEQLN